MRRAVKPIILAGTIALLATTGAARADDLEALAQQYRSHYPASRVIAPTQRCGAYCTGAAFDRIIIFAPVEYDHAYHGHLKVRYLSADEMKKACPPNHLGQRLACAYPNYPKQGSCMVFMGPAEEIEAAGYSDSLAMRHEIGHCNGWSAKHERMRDLLQH